MKNHKLLVIDDDRELGQLIGRAGFMAEFEVVVTETPEFFWQQLDQFRPTVIILDLQMPEMDGVQLLSELGRKQCNAKIIVLSGHDRRTLDSSQRLGLELGLDVVAAFTKPFQIHDLKTFLIQLKGIPLSALSATGADISDIKMEPILINKSDIDHFFMLYQPKIEITTGRVCGVEALIRYDAGDGDIIEPDRFIPSVENSGLINDITKWIIDDVIRQSGIWFKGGLSLQTSINLSAKCIHDRSLPNLIQERCLSYGLPESHLTLELTETAAMTDVIAMYEILTRFRIKGFHLSIDDFGMGYSSIAQLLRLPFSELKIDKSIIINMSHNREAEIITKAIVNMGHNLNLVVTAEGVENESAITTLQEIGCDIAQGYYFAKPIPVEDIPDYSEKLGITSVV